MEECDCDQHVCIFVKFSQLLGLIIVNDTIWEGREYIPLFHRLTAVKSANNVPKYTICE
jgi:hypothetical protein